MDAVKILGSLLGSNATGGNVLGSLLGGATGGGGGGGGLGSLLGGLMGGGQQQPQQSSGGGGLGGLLGGLLGGAGGQQQPQQQLSEEQQAMLLIRAMCNAAKADGQIDKSEIQNIASRMGELDQAEAEFLQRELQAPLDIQGFCQSVPEDMKQNAYAFSLMGMKLDSQQEAQYLGAMAQGLGLQKDQANAIHAKLGAPQIFT